MNYARLLAAGQKERNGARQPRHHHRVHVEPLSQLPLRLAALRHHHRQGRQWHLGVGWGSCWVRVQSTGSSPINGDFRRDPSAGQAAAPACELCPWARRQGSRHGVWPKGCVRPGAWPSFPFKDAAQMRSRPGTYHPKVWAVWAPSDQLPSMGSDAPSVFDWAAPVLD